MLIHTGDSYIHIDKCSFNGLQNRFGDFSSGKVLITSSSFRKSIRPITMGWSVKEVPQSNQIYRPDQGTNYRRWNNEQAFTCVGTTFQQCSGQGGDDHPGGAIWYGYNQGLMNLTSCTFDRCQHNTYGAAVFSISTFKTVVVDHCKFLTMTAKFSVLHLKRGDNAGEYEAMTFVGNQFQDITITGTDGDTVGGGSGFTIRFPTVLQLEQCTFLRCSTKSTSTGGGALFFAGKSETGLTSFSVNQCTFTQTKADRSGGGIYLGKCGSVTISGCDFSDNKGSQQTGGGFLLFAGDLTSLEIRDCYMGSTDASKFGCMGTEAQIRDLSIDNCTVESAGSTNSNAPYSVYLATTGSLSVEGLHMKNMEGGNGRLYLCSSSFTGEIVFRDCSFEHYKTQRLFSDAASQAPLTFESCEFVSLDVVEQNLLEISGGIIQLKQCAFKTVTSMWAILLCRSGNGQLNVEGCNFSDVVIGKDNTGGKEAVFDLSGFNSVSFDSCKFTSNRELQNGILVVNKAGCSIKFSDVLFQDCVINRPSSTDQTYACLEIRAGNVKTFENVRFVSCSYTDSQNAAWILKIAGTMECNLTDCLFQACSCYQSVVLVTNLGNAWLDRCTFRSMEQVKLMKIDTVQNLQIFNTVFDSITYDGNLIDCQAQTLFINDLRVEGSSFTHIAQTSGKTEVMEIRMEESHFTQPLFAITNAEFSALSCTFTGCTGGLLTSSGDGNHPVALNGFFVSNCRPESAGSFVHVSGPAVVQVDKCVFSDCKYQGNSHIVLEGIQSLSMSDACFSGAEIMDGVASYITCSSPDATFQFDVPLCFDYSESSSVNFGEMNPLENLSNTYIVFECTKCEVQIPSEEEEPTTEITTDEETTTEITTDEETSVSETDLIIPTPNADNKGLSPGAIAGIVIGVLVFIAALVLLILMLLLRRRNTEKTRSEAENEAEMPDETVTSVTSMVSEIELEPITEPFASTFNQATTSFEGFEEVWID